MVKLCHNEMEQDLTEKDLVQVEEWDIAKMPPQTKRRRIRGNPPSHYFKPAGIRIRDLQEVILASDECEALRLKDHLSKSQVESAQLMGVSQPTFFRILHSARKKVSTAIVKGHALRVIQ